MATQTTNIESRPGTKLPATMRAVVYRGVNDMRVETVPVPKIGPGELLVKVATCGICGTDLKKIHTGSHSAPRIFGHEMSGIIVETGAGVTRYQVGERVVVHHHVPCGQCYYCRKQTPTQCPLYKKVGVTAGFDPSGGGFAEYIRVMDWIVEGRGVVRIPRDVPFEQAAFVEPLNTVLKGVKLLNLAEDDTVLVIGQGPIGLMHAALARRTGARVLTSDLYPERHAIAARFGLKDPIHAGSENVIERVFEETDGRGADAVVSGRGRQCADQDRNGCGSARRKSDAVCADAAWRSSDRPRRRLHGREDADGSYSSSFEILDEVTDLVFGGYRNGFDLTQLISHRYPLEQAVEAIEIASHPKADSMKIMLEPVLGGGAE